MTVFTDAQALVNAAQQKIVDTAVATQQAAVQASRVIELVKSPGGSVTPTWAPTSGPQTPQQMVNASQQRLTGPAPTTSKMTRADLIAYNDSFPLKTIAPNPNNYPRQGEVTDVWANNFRVTKLNEARLSLYDAGIDPFSSQGKQYMDQVNSQVESQVMRNANIQNAESQRPSYLAGEIDKKLALTKEGYSIMDIDGQQVWAKASPVSVEGTPEWYADQITKREADARANTGTALPGKTVDMLTISGISTKDFKPATISVPKNIPFPELTNASESQLIANVRNASTSRNKMIAQNTLDNFYMNQQYLSAQVHDVTARKDIAIGYNPFEAQADRAQIASEMIHQSLAGGTPNAKFWKDVDGAAPTLKAVYAGQDPYAQLAAVNIGQNPVYAANFQVPSTFSVASLSSVKEITIPQFNMEQLTTNKSLGPGLGAIVAGERLVGTKKVASVGTTVPLYPKPFASLSRTAAPAVPKSPDNYFDSVGAAINATPILGDVFRAGKSVDAKTATNAFGALMRIPGMGSVAAGGELFTTVNEPGYQAQRLEASGYSKDLATFTKKSSSLQANVSALEADITNYNWLVGNVSEKTSPQEYDALTKKYTTLSQRSNEVQTEYDKIALESSALSERLSPLTKAQAKLDAARPSFAIDTSKLVTGPVATLSMNSLAGLEEVSKNFLATLDGISGGNRVIGAVTHGAVGFAEVIPQTLFALPLLIPAGEAIIKQPKQMAASVIPGLGQQSQGMISLAQADPARALGNVYGMAKGGKVATSALSKSAHYLNFIDYGKTTIPTTGGVAGSVNTYRTLSLRKPNILVEGSSLMKMIKMTKMPSMANIDLVMMDRARTAVLDTIPEYVYTKATTASMPKLGGMMPKMPGIPKLSSVLPTRAGVIAGAKGLVPTAKSIKGLVPSIPKMPTSMPALGFKYVKGKGAWMVGLATGPDIKVPTLFTGLPIEIMKGTRINAPSLFYVRNPTRAVTPGQARLLEPFFTEVFKGKPEADLVKAAFGFKRDIVSADISVRNKVSQPVGTALIENLDPKVKAEIVDTLAKYDATYIGSQSLADIVGEKFIRSVKNSDIDTSISPKSMAAAKADLDVAVAKNPVKIGMSDAKGSSVKDSHLIYEFKGRTLEEAIAKDDHPLAVGSSDKYTDMRTFIAQTASGKNIKIQTPEYAMESKLSRLFGRGAELSYTPKEGGKISIGGGKPAGDISDVFSASRYLSKLAYEQKYYKLGRELEAHSNQLKKYAEATTLDVKVKHPAAGKPPIEAVPLNKKMLEIQGDVLAGVYKGQGAGNILGINLGGIKTVSGKNYPVAAPKVSTPSSGLGSLKALSMMVKVSKRSDYPQTKIIRASPSRKVILPYPISKAPIGKKAPYPAASTRENYPRANTTVKYTVATPAVPLDYPTTTQTPKKPQPPQKYPQAERPSKYEPGIPVIHLDYPTTTPPVKYPTGTPTVKYPPAAPPVKYPTGIIVPVVYPPAVPNRTSKSNNESAVTNVRKKQSTSYFGYLETSPIMLPEVIRDKFFKSKIGFLKNSKEKRGSTKLATIAKIPNQKAIKANVVWVIGHNKELTRISTTSGDSGIISQTVKTGRVTKKVYSGESWLRKSTGKVSKKQRRK